jgi:hypothetical protein
VTNWTTAAAVVIVEMADEKMKIEMVIHNVLIHYVTMAVKQHNG